MCILSTLSAQNSIENVYHIEFRIEACTLGHMAKWKITCFFYIKASKYFITPNTQNNDLVYCMPLQVHFYFIELLYKSTLKRSLNCISSQYGALSELQVNYTN